MNERINQSINQSISQSINQSVLEIKSDPQHYKKTGSGDNRSSFPVEVRVQRQQKKTYQ